MVPWRGWAIPKGLDKFKSVRVAFLRDSIDSGKRGGGLIEKLENLNTLAKTNGEGRAKEEDKGGAKCESSISMGTFAFQLNFWGSPLCSTFVYRRQTRRRLSLSLSLTTIYRSFSFFFSLSNFIIKKFFKKLNFPLRRIRIVWLHVCNNRLFRSSLDSAGIIF